MSEDFKNFTILVQIYLKKLFSITLLEYSVKQRERYIY